MSMYEPIQFFRTAAPSVHGGVDVNELAALGVSAVDIIDFSANQSPLGPAAEVAAAIAGADISCYPERNAQPLVEVIAAYHGLMPEQVVVGNGSTELIRLIAQLALHPGDSTLALAHTFGEYQVASELAGAYYHTVSFPDPFQFSVADFDAVLRKSVPRVCWWCSPNNPTGVCATPEEIAALVTGNPDTLFVLDEAYCDLLPEAQWTPELLAWGNLIVLRSMTKAWGLAGLRLGYALGSTTLMSALRGAKAPWNVNACAQAAGIAAFANTTHYTRTLQLLREEKAVLMAGLDAQGWFVLPSQAAFFLLRVGDAAGVKRLLLQHGCLSRDCASFGLPSFLRISPRLPEQNQRLLKAFSTLQLDGGCV